MGRCGLEYRLRVSRHTLLAIRVPKLIRRIRRSLTLVLPYIVEAINEKLLYIFGACNAITIPIGEYCLSWKEGSPKLINAPNSMGAVPRVQSAYS